MLTRLTDDELKFLSRFARSPDFAMLTAIFSKELALQDEKCRTVDAPAVYRFQGAAAWLVAIIHIQKTVDDELLRRAQDRPRPPLRTVKVGAG